MSVNLNYGIYLLRHLICLVNWDQVYHVVPICVRKIKIFVHTFDFPPLKSNSFQLWFTYNSMKEPVTVLSWVIICTLSGSHWSQSNFIPKGHWSSFWGDTQYISIVKIINETAFSLKCHCAVIFYVPTLFQCLYGKNTFVTSIRPLADSTIWSICPTPAILFAECHPSILKAEIFTCAKFRLLICDEFWDCYRLSNQIL